MFVPKLSSGCGGGSDHVSNNGVGGTIFDNDLRGNGHIAVDSVEVEDDADVVITWLWRCYGYDSMVRMQKEVNRIHTLVLKI